MILWIRFEDKSQAYLALSTKAWAYEDFFAEKGTLEKTKKEHKKAQESAETGWRSPVAFGFGRALGWP
jgi:hypothetical protein